MPAPNQALSPARLAEEFGRQLTAVLETMTGEAPIVTFAAHEIREGDSFDADFLWWEQRFQPGADRRIWIGASPGGWQHIGKAVLNAAEPSDQDPSALRETYLGILRQALSGVGGAISRELGSEISAAGGSEDKPNQAGGATFSFDVALGSTAVPVLTVFNDAWSQPAAVEPASETAPPISAEPPRPNTIDLLLDVELPVSISFGRTQLPLKDVIKLTTGSIVELNRSVTEPVEVIVNNCVIARAEVVVVEGNFGIRIKQVVSRQERLRTLN